MRTISRRVSVNRSRSQVFISRGNACSLSPKGDLPKAACGTLIGICGLISRRVDARGGGGGSSWQGGLRRCEIFVICNAYDPGRTVDDKV